MKKISIIIPIYHEEKNIVLMYNALSHVFLSLQSYTYQIIFIDDGSSDNSWFEIKKLIQKDSRVEGVSFSRNFGYQMALTAGYDYAQGDAVIVMDGDLQHPPIVIPAMIHKWQEGFDIVYGRRSYREEGWLRQLTGTVYYKLLNKISDIKLPGDISDFCLIDKKVHKVVKQCRDREPYMRGTIAWTGFTYTFIDFVPVARAQGTSSYSWLRLIKLAFDGLTSLSRFPLEIAAYIGSFVIITGSLMFMYIAVDAFIYHARYPLFKWLTVVLYMATGIQFLLMWLLGEYIGRIYSQLKQRPLYVVKEHVESHDSILKGMNKSNEESHLSSNSHL
ncbi:MAG: glycosyltransferase involved in cell wall biosynthesis [Alteromonas naphthalenivorans]|jgi:glycosyltransferase involved in cell wall biosynthesis